MTIKRNVLIIMTLCLPLMVFANVLQAFEYQSLLSVIQEQEDQQKVWVDRNKEILTAIEVLRAPERLDDIGTGELGLTRVPGDEQIKVIFSTRLAANTGGRGE
jgi:hypothetical protein